MKKVIHVDNSEFFRKLMRTFLEAEGFEVESFEDAQEASFAIGAGSGAMVIMGLTFAGIGGEEFLSKIAESFSGPVVVVSSSMDSGRAERLVDLGARATFSKEGSWKAGLKPHLSALK